jgi:hypothetical protein
MLLGLLEATFQQRGALTAMILVGRLPGCLLRRLLY